MTETLSLCLATQRFGDIQSGVDTYASLLVEGLRKSGHDVTVVTPDTSGSEPRRGSGLGLFEDQLRGANWLLASYRISKILKRVTRSRRFDIVHFLDAREGFLSRLDLAVGTVHDFYSAIAPWHVSWYKSRYPCDPWRRLVYYRTTQALERRFLPQLTHLISDCDYTANELATTYDIPLEQFTVVYNGIDVDQFRARAARIPEVFQGKSPQVLFVGGNFQRKNLPLLIRASADVVEVVPETRFHVAGSDPHRRFMEAYTRKMGVSNNFEFLGHVGRETLQLQYLLADVVTLPSLYESFPNVFLEAMALGTPVIGSYVGGAPELIRHWENGLLVDPTDVQGLANVLIRLLEDEKLRRSLSKSALRTVRGFSAERMVSETIKVYRSCLAAR